jgi:hypothetical protein
LRRKDSLGILGQSSRNLYAGNPNASVGFGGGGGSGKSFARSPPKHGYSFPGNNNRPSQVDTARDINNGENIISNDSSNQESTGTQNDTVDTGARVGSLKEKLKNWSKVSNSATTPISPYKPIPSAAERARRYRNRQKDVNNRNE